MKTRRMLGVLGAAAFAVAGVILIATPSMGSDRWEQEKGNCEQVFQSADTVVLQQLKLCVGRWLAYVDANLLKPAEKQQLKETFQSLYNRAINKGDDEGEYLAIEGSNRVGLRLQMRVPTPTPTQGTSGQQATPETTQGQETASERVRFVPPQVSSRDAARATTLVRQGIAQFRRGKRDRALAKYQQALELDPGNLDAIFNAAAEHAFRSDGSASVELLQRLQDIGTRPAIRRLAKARTDPDFKPIQDYRPYKVVSGFARIKVVNSVGVYGEDEVERIVTTLKELSHPVEDTGNDKVQGRTAPVLWYKPHSAATAYLVKKVVLHPGTTLTKINWQTDYDIIVSWGMQIVTRDGVEQPATDYTDVSPEEAETRMDDLLREEDKILREPEQAARRVDHAVETPQRVERRVDGSVDRVERTVDTIERTGGRIEGLFK